jgi:hypothetical protein
VINEFKFSAMAKAESLIECYDMRSIVSEERLEKKHILFIGDSFVYGCNIPYEDTMSRQLEEKVNKSNEYSIFNLGLPGGSLESSLLRLQQWCNSYGNQIHSVYFGMTSRYRIQYWIDVNGDEVTDIYDSTKSFNNSHSLGYMPGRIPPPEATVGEERFISKNLNNLMSVSNLQTGAKFDHIMQNFKNLSQLHNFNTFSFYVSDEHISTADSVYVKERLESNTIGSEFKIHMNDISFPRDNNVSYQISPDDGHWNNAGNKFVTDTILYPQTQHWYL